VAAILAAADLPASTFLLTRPLNVRAFDRYYKPHGDLQAMLRLAVDRSAFRPPQRPGPAVERLGQDDLPLLLDLHAGYEASAFNPDQLRSGPFYGVRQGGALLAAGGIHALSVGHLIGAVGNFYTRPDARGRGYGTAIAAAVVGELLAGPCEDVILNVSADNAVAQRLYNRLGFRAHCEYLEGRVVRR
jgi:ribosomal protein S18 acetylase RimI-like enzyme